VVIKIPRTITKQKPGRSGPRWTPTQQERGRNRYPGMEIDRMMEYPEATRHRTCGASSFSADERMEGGKPREGPAVWTEWKQDDDQAYQQYLDGFFREDKD
jgi:hypothetical protein